MLFLKMDTGHMTPPLGLGGALGLGKTYLPVPWKCYWKLFYLFHKATLTLYLDNIAQIDNLPNW